MKVNYYSAKATNSNGDRIQVEVLVVPEYIERPELSAIRFIADNEIVFQVKGPKAHNLIVDMADMLRETGVGRIPF